MENETPSPSRKAQETPLEPQESHGERTGEGTQENGPTFGGLSPAEAGRRSAEARRKRREQAAEDIQADPGLVNIRRIAASGKGYNAVQAQRYLDDLEAKTRAKADETGLLALLTAEQRACIEAVLRGEDVSQAQAVEAWASEVPA